MVHGSFKIILLVVAHITFFTWKVSVEPILLKPNLTRWSNELTKKLKIGFSSKRKSEGSQGWYCPHALQRSKRIYYSKDIFAEWTKAKYNHKIKSSIKLIHENIFIKAASLLFDSGFNQGNNNLSNICMLFQVHNTPHCRSLMRLIIKVIDNGIFERSLVFSPSNMLYNRPVCCCSLMFLMATFGGTPFNRSSMVVPIEGPG